MTSPPGSSALSNALAASGSGAEDAAARATAAAAALLQPRDRSSSDSSGRQTARSPPAKKRHKHGASRGSRRASSAASQQAQLAASNQLILELLAREKRSDKHWSRKRKVRKSKASGRAPDLKKLLEQQVLAAQRSATPKRSESSSSSSRSSSSDDEERGSALSLVRPPTADSLTAASVPSVAAIGETSSAKASPFVLLDTRPESVLQWAQGSINRIIYQDFADIAVALVTFQDFFKKLRPEEKCLAAFNTALTTTQIGLDHCKVAEISEFGWQAVGAMRSRLSTADPNMHKQWQEVESSLRKQAKNAGLYTNKGKRLVYSNLVIANLSSAF